MAAPAQAVVVLKKGTSEPLFGYLVRQDENQVVVREEQPGGGTRDRSILRADIDELILPVAPERLAALDPARPQDYREYAEELAEKARDPEAREAAVRLYIIAAFHGDAKLRKSALLGLAGLAESPAEERRLRAAAYLHDAAHEAALIRRPTAAPVVPSPAARAGVVESIQALRAIRQNKPTEARLILERESVRQPLEMLAGTITREQLLTLATLKPIADQSLRQLLTAEVLLERSRGEAPAAAEKPPSTAWSDAAGEGGLDPLPSLELLQLTPFDPRACVYRNGKWVVP